MKVLDEMRWSVVFGGFVTDEFLICFVSLYPCKALKNGFFAYCSTPRCLKNTEKVTSERSELRLHFKKTKVH